MISIVNKTVWVNPHGFGAGLPLNITIPAVTAGNTIVLVGADNQAGAGGGLATLGSGAESFTSANAWEQEYIYYRLSAAGGETYVRWTYDAPAVVVIYELTPCTFVGTNVNFGSPATTQQIGRAS